MSASEVTVRIDVTARDTGGTKLSPWWHDQRARLERRTAILNGTEVRREHCE